MTKEQIIVLAFLVAAFVAGWSIRALTGRPGEAGEPSAAPGPSDPQLDRAVEQTRLELDRAIRGHLTTLAASLGARDADGEGLADGHGEGDPFRVERTDAESRGRDLVQGVSAALQSDVAVELMLSVLPEDRRDALYERELDIADWGFAYGVAWGLARERRPEAPADEIAAEAQRAAEAVFREYMGAAAEDAESGSSFTLT
jgi:hypothetical protein